MTESDTYDILSETILAVLIVAVNLLVDLTYMLLDPRIRLE